MLGTAALLYFSLCFLCTLGKKETNVSVYIYTWECHEPKVPSRLSARRGKNESWKGC